MGLTIRELTARDRYALAALIRAVTGRDVDDRSPATAAFLTDPSTFVVGAYIDDAPVGWAWGSAQRRPDGRIATYVHEMDVSPSARRRGVGSMLLRATMARARRAGHDRLWLTTGAGNEAGSELYRSLGGRRSNDGDVVWSWSLD